MIMVKMNFNIEGNGETVVFIHGLSDNLLYWEPLVAGLKNDYNTVKDAKREFNRLYNQLDFLPEEVAKFVKNLKKDFDKTINHIKRKDIPKTNNLLEGFFKITFPKKYKRRFRTEKGVKNYLRHMRIRWYERNVLHEKIKI